MVCENFQAVNAVIGEAGRLFTLSKLGNTAKAVYIFRLFGERLGGSPKYPFSCDQSIAGVLVATCSKWL